MRDIITNLIPNRSNLPTLAAVATIFTCLGYYLAGLRTKTKLTKEDFLLICKICKGFKQHRIITGLKEDQGPPVIFASLFRRKAACAHIWVIANINDQKYVLLVKSKLSQEYLPPGGYQSFAVTRPDQITERAQKYRICDRNTLSEAYNKASTEVHNKELTIDHNLLDTAHRELFEEIEFTDTTNIPKSDIKFTGFHEFPDTFQTIFLCEINCNELPGIKPKDDSEIDAATWIPIENFHISEDKLTITLPEHNPAIHTVSNEAFIKSAFNAILPQQKKITSDHQTNPHYSFSS